MIILCSFIGKARRKELLGRPSCRCGDNIMPDHREREWDDMDWINLPEDRGQ
jgi:hypothetical protein